jgi:hypothetical protein
VKNMLIFIHMNRGFMSICISTTSITSTLTMDQSLNPIRTRISIPLWRTSTRTSPTSTIGTLTGNSNYCLRLRICSYSGCLKTSIRIQASPLLIEFIKQGFGFFEVRSVEAFG